MINKSLISGLIFLLLSTCAFANTGHLFAPEIGLQNTNIYVGKQRVSGVNCDFFVRELGDTAIVFVFTNSKRFKVEQLLCDTLIKNDSSIYCGKSTFLADLQKGQKKLSNRDNLPWNIDLVLTEDDINGIQLLRYYQNRTLFDRVDCKDCYGDCISELVSLFSKLDNKQFEIRLKELCKLE